MSEARIDTSKTAITRPFAGRKRVFQLRLGEIEALERLCGAGIGEIGLRLLQHRFYAGDVWETIRLGLEGGGMDPMLVTGLVERYQHHALVGFVELAAGIIDAALSGVPVEEPSGNDEAEGSEPDPETSPPSMNPEASSG